MKIRKAKTLNIATS